MAASGEASFSASLKTVGLSSLKTVGLSRRSFAWPPIGGRYFEGFFDNSDSLISFSYLTSPTAPRVGAAGGILFLFLSECVVQTCRVRAAMAHSFISSGIQCEDSGLFRVLLPMMYGSVLPRLKTREGWLGPIKYRSFQTLRKNGHYQLCVHARQTPVR